MRANILPQAFMRLTVDVNHFLDVHDIILDEIRILHIIMSILFLSCTLYFGMISFRAGTDTMVFDIGFTGIVFVFFIYTLNGMTKRCERYKEKVVYSCLFTKREYNLSDIASSNEKIEEFYKDYGDGNVSNNWD